MPPAGETQSLPPPPRRGGGFLPGLIGGLLGGAVVAGGGGWYVYEHGPIKPALSELQATTGVAQDGQERRLVPRAAGWPSWAKASRPSWGRRSRPCRRRARPRTAACSKLKPASPLPIPELDAWKRPTPTWSRKVDQADRRLPGRGRPGDLAAGGGQRQAGRGRAGSACRHRRQEDRGRHRRQAGEQRAGPAGDRGGPGAARAAGDPEPRGREQAGRRPADHGRRVRTAAWRRSPRSSASCSR